MTDRRDDDIERRERVLKDAQRELASVQRQGERAEPLLDRLAQHAKENRFAERFLLALDQTRRRHA
jgi:hypothetical protein